MKKKKKKRNYKKLIKRFFIFITPILLFSLLFVLFIMLLVPDIELVGGEKVVLGAHRGNSIDYIENTLPAFQSAVEEDKYSFIEFDIQYTKDKQMVVHHDKSLLRLQGKKYNIEDLNYDELLEVSYYHIPLYSEVMEIVAGKKPINIEIKSQGNIEDDKKMVDFVLDDLKARRILNTTLISSISSDVLIYLNEKYLKVMTGKIYYISSSTFLHFDTFTARLYDELNKTGADYLMLHGSNLRNYASLKDMLPEDRAIVIWYFTDEMYVVQPEFYFGDGLGNLKLRIRDYFSRKTTLPIRSREDLFEKSKEGCIWWC